MKFYKRKDFRKLHIFSPNTGAWKKLVAVLLKSQPLYISSSVITNRILINILFCYCLLSARKPRSSSLRLKKKEKHKDNISQTGKKLIHVPFKSLFYNHATKCITAAPVSFHFLPLKELCNTSPDWQELPSIYAALQNLFFQISKFTHKICLSSTQMSRGKQ